MEKATDTTDEIVEEVPSEFIEVTVDGVDLSIQRKKLGSWKYLTLLKRQIEATQAVAAASDEKRSVAYGNLLDASINLVTFVCGDKMDLILKHLGELASYSEVMAFYNAVIKAVNAKN